MGGEACPPAEQQQVGKKAVTGEPKLELAGDVWVASHQKDTTLDMGKVGTTQSIQASFCENVKFVVPEKVLSIAVINCKGVEIDMKSCISGMELTNSEGVKVRVKGMLPSAAIDKCQTVAFWINKVNAEMIMFTSCKSGDMNVNVNLNETDNVDEDDWVEMAIHEQFEHRITPQMKMETKPSILY
ncbi:hypothetical protein BgAZ_305930 [Babesia gibsoni]|uniref:C-CAP/cofactor C-like domain-containing protein n=1 Tax=Babesia gibsoni TaxID=33632 RepID=A0AAD8LI18_BABGI|nr:hypothetical protein BgAZ_305930 [Babesia gibsoni]